MHRDAVQTLLDAFGEIGLQASDGHAQGEDVMLEGPRGPLTIEVKGMSLADRSRVQSQIEQHQKLAADRLPRPDFVVVVADQLPEEAREILRQHGWGYLDRRGAIWLRSRDLVINDTTLDPLRRHPGRPSSGIRGRVGLGVALRLLMRPQAEISIRELARLVGAAPSTVHESVNRLREHALIEGDGRPLVPELFVAVAEVWRPEHIPVARQPRPSDTELGLNLKDDGQGWVVGGDVGAAASGAPVVAGSGSPPDFYVPSSGLVRRAVRQLGESAYEGRGATVAVAPSPVVTAENFYVKSWRTPWLEWPIAHPVVLALDLAQDLSRGREILAEWTPQGFDRVW